MFRFLILIILSFVIVLWVVKVVFGISTINEHGYIACKYGEYCYIEGQHNKKCKYPIYFSTLDKCKKYLNK